MRSRIGANGIDFGSDPSLACDTSGNLFYSYIVVFFGAGNGINGTELAVARSRDGGNSYPSANFFSFSGGKDHFNDKPVIAADTNLSSSPFRDNIYALGTPRVADPRRAASELDNLADAAAVDPFAISTMSWSRITVRLNAGLVPCSASGRFARRSERFKVSRR